MVNSVSGQRAYSPTQGTVSMAPEPIIAQRAPLTSDRGFVGQVWVNEVTQFAYICCGTVANLTTWQAIGGGAADFSSLTVTPGPVSLTGTTSINITGAGRTNIGSATSTGVITLETNAATGTDIAIVANNAAGGVLIGAGTGGINFDSAGIIQSQDTAVSAAPATNTITINAPLGTATFPGFTTGAGITQTFIITNSFITTTSGILVTAMNEGTNAAEMTVVRVNRAAGQMTVSLLNSSGASALNGNISIGFWVYRS